MKGSHGVVFQEVTRNSALPPAAKGLYAYLAAFCGNSDKCYPSVDTILQEMGMSKDTFYKHIKLLVEAGVIEKQQRREKDEKFGSVVYRVNHSVCFKKQDKPCPKKPNTEKADTGKKPTREKSDKPCPKNPEHNNNNRKITDKKEIYKEKSQRFEPPSLEEVQAYCHERSNGIDAQHFTDFYASKGWMVGKNRMKDWKAAVRTWERNKKSKGEEAVESNSKNQSGRSAADFYEQFLGTGNGD